MFIFYQIMELENQISELQEELRSTPARRLTSTIDWVPRAPARHSLAGHRSPITRVAFHPIYNILATASEDMSIKLWDWETGEFERTLKGHTREVKDIDFDSQGSRLGNLVSFSFFSLR